MAQSTPPLPGRYIQRPPKMNLKNLYASTPGGNTINSVTSSTQPPHTAQTTRSATAQQPYWPQYSNPFAAGNFMAKGFEGFVDFTKSGMSFGEKFTYGLYNKFSKWSKKWFTHMFLLTVITLYSAGGALLFGAIEGRQTKQDFLDTHAIQKDFFKAMQALSQDHELRKYSTAEFNGKMIFTLREHKSALDTLLNNNKTIEELEKAHEPWTFWNAMFYCGTIYTTIGYGHITPKTKLGQSLTIIYAIIGIPMFLIVLADFGKLFTRGMKFIWAYVRRLYYTGTCRKIRKQQQVRDALSGFNTVYDMALRRPSHFFGIAPETDVESQTSDPSKSALGVASHPETPTSPYPETFEIDDEFNLPVSLASILLISYILLGAFFYTLWEDWSYFEAFYFVFISMSTIGFGDFVPNHPIFMMCSIIYLIFGLALTSMFINVVQIKLSDTFKHASAKIGATIGFEMASEMDDEIGSQMKTPSEIASVHGVRLDPITEQDKEGVTTPVSILRPTIHITDDETNGDVEHELLPPPLMPKRQVITVETPQEPEQKQKKKRRFFK